jgi:hypothetical protein
MVAFVSGLSNFAPLELSGMNHYLAGSSFNPDNLSKSIQRRYFRKRFWVITATNVYLVRMTEFPAVGQLVLIALQAGS